MARCPTCHRRLSAQQACATHGVVGVAPARGETLATPSWSQSLTACIGRGGFAAVWEIAGGGGVLKVAHADHELARARMRREAEALAAIGPPAVPRLHASGVLDDGRAWIAMDRVAGENLADTIAAGTLRVDQAVAIGEAILAALARVHAGGFVHRDLKPDNLVRTPAGIVILDLGLARRIPDDTEDPTRAGVQVGSLEYMPPEQLLDAASAGVRADLYAFGCVLYELCAGRPPFVGDARALERAHAALRPPPLAALAPVPPPLEALVHDCLAKLPERRPGSADELRARLAALRDATPSLQRAQHTMSVLREGKQPVVLVWAELPRVDRTLLGMLSARKLTVISQRGRRVLAASLGADHADPAGAALAAARDLATAGARVALHLDALAVQASATGTIVGGPAVDDPQSWLPPAPWTGIAITRALGTVLQVPMRALDQAGFVTLGERSQAAELFGRDALVADLASEAAAALAGQGPGLALLVGDPGIGKTAIATALIPQLRELGARVHAGEVPPPGSGKPSSTALAQLVAGLREAPGVRAIGDALRAAARAQPAAVIVDNVHLADAELLDALEYATLGGEALPLWVLAIGTPRLEERRPSFGARAERRRREVVPPLSEDASVALAAALLRPAEYPPLRALRQLAGIAHGNPMHLATLARELHDRGAIRRRPNGEYFLDTTTLDSLPTLALGPWLAARVLAQLAPELAALARLCAALGDDLARDEIAAVVERVERRGGATTTIDVDVGLAELVQARVLEHASATWSFRQALVREGIYATTDEQERVALHAAALDYWRGRPAPDAARLARHAEAVGERGVAAQAFAVLGTRAQAEHHELDADQAWEGALRNLDPGDPRRPEALLGRARARYRMQRRIEAVADVERVLELATASGDRALEVEALLELATIHDWTGSFEQSRVAAERARDRGTGLEVPVLRVGIELAQARSLYRAQQFDEATPALYAVAEAARAAGTAEHETIARLLLGLVLVDTGALDAAEHEFELLLALCARTGDRFHLAGVYINRARLWSVRGQFERGAADMREVIQLAREGGQPQLERVATYNAAQDLLWQGELDEALRLARRSLALQLGQGEGSAAVDRVLVARVLAARQDRVALADVLDAIARDDQPTDELDAEMNNATAALLDVLRAVAGQGTSWEAALAAAGALPTMMQIEVGLLAAAEGQLREPLRGQVVALAQADPAFARRLPELLG